MKFVAVDRERVVLANVDGAFYALRDVCGHRNAPLSRGKLIGCLIECPLHFAQFDLRTGKLVDGPISADVPVYEVRVEGDTVYSKPPLALPESPVRAADTSTARFPDRKPGPASRAHPCRNSWRLLQFVTVGINDITSHTQFVLKRSPR